MELSKVKTIGWRLTPAAQSKKKSCHFVLAAVGTSEGAVAGGQHGKSRRREKQKNCRTWHDGYSECAVLALDSEDTLDDVLRRSVAHYGYFGTPVALSFAMVRAEQIRAEAATLHDALTPAFLGRVDVALMQVCIISKIDITVSVVLLE